MDAKTSESESAESLFESYQRGRLENSTLTLTSLHFTSYPSRSAILSQTLHSRYNRLVVWTLKRRYSLRHHDAEEIAQEAWASIFRRTKPAGGFIGLLILRATAIAVARLKRPSVACHSIFNADGETIEPATAAVGRPDSVLKQHAVRTAFSMLTKTQQEVATAVLLDGDSVRSVASRLELPIASIERMLEIITERLRFLLRDWSDQ